MTLTKTTHVALVDIHEVGDLLVCGDCAPDSKPVTWQFSLVDLDAFCDYCGRDLTGPRMFYTTPHALKLSLVEGGETR